jgi:hypothetical protein
MQKFWATGTFTKISKESLERLGKVQQGQNPCRQPWESDASSHGSGTKATMEAPELWRFQEHRTSAEREGGRERERERERESGRVQLQDVSLQDSTS